MSSDEEVITTRKKKYLVESDDSDEEIPNNASSIDSKDTIEEVKEDETKVKNKTRRLKAFESSSDSEDESNGKISTDISTNNRIISPKNLSSKDNIDIYQDKKDQSSVKNKTPWYKNSDLFECDSSEDEDNFKPLSEQQSNQNKKSWNQNSQDLFAADSSGEENNHSQEKEQSNNEEENMEEDCSKPLPLFPKKERASKSKAMNEIQEIQKESQRMMRESRVTIPYHRPKQRTLAEFRARKKLTPSVSLHTSADKLISAWKAIEEREKQAEIFYKSESSSDESGSDETKQKSDKTELEKLDKMTDKPYEENSDVKGNSNTLTNEEKQDSVCKDVDSIEDLIDARENVDKISNANNIDEDAVHKESFESEEPLVGSNETTKMLIENNASRSSNSENEQFSLNLGIELKCANKDLISSVTKSIITTETEAVYGKQPDCGETIDQANTEEFSLRMSESQSELETSDQQRSFDTVDRNETPVNKESDENEVLESSVVVNRSMEVESSEAEKECLISNSDEILNKDALFTKKIEPDETDLSTSLNLNKKECFEKINEDDLSESKLLRKKYNLPLNDLTDAPKMTAFDAEEIVLDKVVSKPGVDNLIERFFTHLSYKKKPVKKRTPLELSIVSADTDSSGQVNGINKEIVNVLVGEEEEEEDPSLAKPGAKLVRLKAHLQAEIERQRQQEWAKKQQEQQLYEEEIYEGEKDVCDADEEGDDDGDENAEESDDNKSEDEEEEEVEEEESEEDEEHEEKKKRTTSAFIDDEAEESEDDNCIETEEVSSDSFIKKLTKKKIVIHRTKTEDMFLSQEALKSSVSPDDEEMPSFQKPQITEDKFEETEESYSPVCPSPAFRLTGLEGKDTTHSWSRQSTPCKDLSSPKIITPVRSKPFAGLVDRSPLVGSQDLENLCSGNFSSQPVPDDEEGNNTQDFQLFMADDSQISQDMGTPLDTLTLGKESASDGKKHIRSLLVDDDDDITMSITTKTTKKLNFSDDESEDEENNQQPKDQSEESDVEEGVVDTNADVEYDSEENEVVKTAGDFLDKEAELSESEWGSEDEDEDGLDILDTEEADKEKIDQRRLQQQLGQMHMKQVLIEDKREVRLLQELLLEDGELHSENRRKRLFRWSNNTTFGDDNKASLDSDEDKAEEDEDEENWRKARHEREQFLAEHSKKSEHLELAVEEHFDSKLIQKGQKTLQRLKSSSQTPLTIKPSESLPSPDPKKPYSLLMNMKRGSFLSRGQQVLSRLAQIVSSSDGPINQPKNSRNFVFASISPTKDQEKEVKPLQSNKRKMPILPLPVAKKPCVKKPKMANKKSLFEALAKVNS